LAKQITITITNIRLFCEFLKEDLAALIDSNLLKVEINEEDIVEAFKNLKI
jgi:hypothetical protein